MRTARSKGRAKVLHPWLRKRRSPDSWVVPRFLFCCQPIIFLVPKLERLQSNCEALEFVDTTSENEEENYPLGVDHKPDLVAYIPACSRRETTDFSRVEVMVTVKATESHDPFRDLPPLDEHPATDTMVQADTPEGTETLGQMAAFAAEQMAQQLRPWVFSVVIFGDHARLIRWDRSGAIFTPRFDYRESGHLEKFFTCYGSLDPGSRGVDTSITTLEDDDPKVELAKKGIGFKSQHYPHPRFYEFRLGSHHTVVGYSPESTPSLIGRASQPFIVWDSTNQKKRFLKDTWRVDSPGVLVEGEIYELLESKHVPNIASVVWHGDIDKCHALTSELQVCVGLDSTYAMLPLTQHKHYRLMLDKVGRPCTEYENQYHFFTIIHQAALGEYTLSPPLVPPICILTLSYQPTGSPIISRGYCTATSACGIS